MAVVQNVIADQSGAPIAGTNAIINLVSPSGAFLLGTQTQVQQTFLLTTGINGQWQQDLTPNASIGSDSYYVVSEPAASKATAFVVPAGAGPYWLSTVKLPAPPGTVQPPPLLVSTSIASSADYSGGTPTNGQALVWSAAAGKWAPTTLVETIAAYLRVGPTHRTVAYGDANAAHVVIDKEADASDASLLLRSAGYLTGVVGAVGDTDLHVRVANGNPGTETFTDGLIVKRTTGYVYVPTQLGVGAVPAAPLHVSGATATVLARIQNTNGSGSTTSGVQLTGGTNNWQVSTDLTGTGVNNLAVLDNNYGSTPRLLIDTSGHVGVGTPTPAARLDVAGALRTAPIVLNDATTITTDASLSNHFRVTLGGNRTLANPTNPVDAQRVTWEITQDGTGSRTLTLGSAFVFGTDITSVTLSTGPGKTDYLGAIYNATASTWRVSALARGF